MIGCIQRVRRASVTVSDGVTGTDRVTGAIGRGLLVLLGVGRGDNESEADRLAAKITGLRIFDDADGKMNLSLSDVGGSVLVVSQFTLFGDCRHGRRPGFTDAAPPELAKTLYDYFVQRVRSTGTLVETGIFQAMMAVELVNDGPVTLWIDSRTIGKRGPPESSSPPFPPL